MKKYLLAALLTTCSLTTLAATCPKGQDQLLIAGQNICGLVTPGKSAEMVNITMKAGPHSELYNLHKHKLNKMTPGVFKLYVDSLKTSTIPTGVAHAIDTVTFTDAKENNTLYAGKTFSCGTPSVTGVKDKDIKHAMLILPSCVVAAPVAKAAA